MKSKLYKTHDCQGDPIGKRADWRTKVNGHYFRMIGSYRDRKNPVPGKKGHYLGTEKCTKCGKTQHFEYSFL